MVVAPAVGRLGSKERSRFYPMTVANDCNGTINLIASACGDRLQLAHGSEHQYSSTAVVGRANMDPTVMPSPSRDLNPSIEWTASAYSLQLSLTGNVDLVG